MSENSATDKENASSEKDEKLKKFSKRKDPTARWSERVKEMSSSFKRHPSNYSKHADDYAEGSCSKMDFQHFSEVAQQCIKKRPLTSMVVAVTAGATLAALLSAITRKRD